MSEYRETRTVVEEVPIKRARPVVETQYDSVRHETRGMSGGAIAALVLAVIAAAIVITMLILNSQQRDTEDQLALERDQMIASTSAYQGLEHLPLRTVSDDHQSRHGLEALLFDAPESHHQVRDPFLS